MEPLSELCIKHILSHQNEKQILEYAHCNLYLCRFHDYLHLSGEKTHHMLVRAENIEKVVEKLVSHPSFVEFCNKRYPRYDLVLCEGGGYKAVVRVETPQEFYKRCLKTIADGNVVDIFTMNKLSVL